MQELFLLLFVYITELVIRFADTIGCIVLFFGIVSGLYHFLLCRLFGSRSPHHSKKRTCFTIDAIRLEVGRYILLSLEFFIAADILKTIFTPTWDEIGKLGAIILIRTVLSFFLVRELNIPPKKK